MQTNFFTEILKTGLTNFVLQVIKTEGVVSVVLSPKTKTENSSLNSMVPIVLKASTSEEIDEKFLELISKPLEKTSEVFSNIEEYENSIAKIEKEKAEKKKAAEESKKSKTKTSSKKEEVEIDDDEIETCEAPEVKEKPVKPKKDSPYKKYEDPVLELVSTDNFAITVENRSQLKDLVDKLLIMDKSNEIGLEWEQKLKDFKKSLETTFTELDEQNIPEQKQVLEIPVELIEEIASSDKDATQESNDLDSIFDFEDFMND